MLALLGRKEKKVGFAKCTYGRLLGKEECGTGNIRYRAMLFSGYAEKIYGILQENISVSGIDALD